MTTMSYRSKLLELTNLYLNTYVFNIDINNICFQLNNLYIEYCLSFELFQ